MKLVSVGEMRKIEQEADAGGLSYEAMMANAGYNLAKEIQSLSFSEEDEEIQILGLVGPGNNGGDALVALSLLAERGWKARAYLVKRKATGDPLVKNLEEADGEIVPGEKDTDFTRLTAFLGTADVLLDGLLGTGFHLPLKDEIASVLAAAKQILSEMEWPPLIIAVDCPSGVDCDSGEAAPEAIQADATVTMAAVKEGLLKTPAYDLSGDIRVVDIGLKETLQSWTAIKTEVADEAMVRSLLPARPSDAHKGTFGTALIAAGSVNFTGAALLAGKAAYRVGAGLVTLAIPLPLHVALAGQFPEATWLLLPHELGVISANAASVILKNLERVTALLIGPGFGLEDTTRDFMGALLEAPAFGKSAHNRIGFVKEETENPASRSVTMPPLVVDADGLKLLAKIENWHKILPAPAVLTPHPGEMAVLTGLTVEAIQKDRQEIARRYAQKWGHVVVLKGAFTIVAAPDGRTTTIPVASSALARAGSGDVLSGMIVGLRAQGLDPYAAAVAGAWIHAQAGLMALEAVGSPASILAGDILEAVPDVLAQMR